MQFAGRWFTSFGPMLLREDGARVQGTYGAGATENVLFVNDSPGDAERIVRLFAHEPITIFVASPPLATGPRPG